MPRSSEFSKAVTDVSIIALVVVIAIVLIVAVSMFMLVRFLRAAAEEGGRGPPVTECAAWLEARRRGRARGEARSLPVG
jgi:hypothetical protein